MDPGSLALASIWIPAASLWHPQERQQLESLRLIDTQLAAWHLRWPRRHYQLHSLLTTMTETAATAASAINI